VLERKAIRYWILIIQYVFEAYRQRGFLDCDECWVNAWVANLEIEFSLDRGGSVFSCDCSYFYCVVSEVAARKNQVLHVLKVELHRHRVEAIDARNQIAS